MNCYMGNHPHLLIFGYSYHYALPRICTHGEIFSTKARKCVFVGYPHCQKGWRLYDLQTDEFLISRDVTFLEDQFPYVAPELQEETITSVGPWYDTGLLQILDEHLPLSTPRSPTLENADPVSTNSELIEPLDQPPQPPVSSVTAPSQTKIQVVQLCRSSRQTHLPAKLKGYVTSTTHNTTDVNRAPLPPIWSRITFDRIVSRLLIKLSLLSKWLLHNLKHI